MATETTQTAPEELQVQAAAERTTLEYALSGDGGGDLPPADLPPAQLWANRSSQVQQQQQFHALANAHSQVASFVPPVQRLVASSLRPIQRVLYKEGSSNENAAPVPSHAKSMARYVTSKTSIQPGGKLHIADIQGRGFPGFKKGKEEFAGGRPFGGVMTDTQKNRLPGNATYQEWDINPCVAGQNRGTERIVTSSKGNCYYTNSHYEHFTEFTI